MTEVRKLKKYYASFINLIAKNDTAARVLTAVGILIILVIAFI